MSNNYESAFDDRGASRRTGDRGRRGAGATSLPLAAKRCLDLVSAAVGCIAFSPLMIAIALVSLVIQGRPIFARRRLVGRGGRPFYGISFRIAPSNAAWWGLPSAARARTSWTLPGTDAERQRRLSFGSLLHETGLVDLPCLLNVLKGDMSLVGPTPISIDKAEIYGVELPHCLSLRPGLITAWQIRGDAHHDGTDKIQSDIDYVSNWKLTSDLLILLKLVPAMIRSA